MALVLSGGGARGAFDVGVAKAVLEAGITPQILAGTSAGALTAAGLAMGWDTDRLETFWCGQETRHVMRPRLDLHRLFRLGRLLGDPRRFLGFGEHTASEALLDLFGWTWLFHMRPLRRRIVDAIGGEVLPLQPGRILTVSAVEVDTGEFVRFSNAEPADGRSGDGLRVVQMTVDHILASAAIPGLFEPVEIDGRSYWDGGLASNTPLAAAFEHEPDAAVVVASAARHNRPYAPRSFGDVIGLAVEHLFTQSLVVDLDHARTVNRLVASGQAETVHRIVELVTVTPSGLTPGIGQLLDFEPSRAARFIEDGYRAARESLADEETGETT